MLGLFSLLCQLQSPVTLANGVEPPRFCSAAREDGTSPDTKGRQERSGEKVREAAKHPQSWFL